MPDVLNYTGFLVTAARLCEEDNRVETLVSLSESEVLSGMVYIELVTEFLGDMHTLAHQVIWTQKKDGAEVIVDRNVRKGELLDKAMMEQSFGGQ